MYFLLGPHDNLAWTALSAAQRARGNDAPNQRNGPGGSGLKFTIWKKFQLPSIKMHITMGDMDQILLLKNKSLLQVYSVWLKR